MTLKTMKVKGVFVERGKIRLANSRTVEWFDLSAASPPCIPYGTKIEMMVTYEERDYLGGQSGIVWATYHYDQAETIKNALLAQNVVCEVHEEPLESGRLYLLRVPELRKIEEAMDFIWRDNAGLKLQPDWIYPAGVKNESFQRWVQDI